MPFSPRQIALHWVPGFTLLVMIFFLIDGRNGGALTRSVQGWNTGIVLLAAAAAGFVIGNFLDAIRDFSELWLDRLPGCEINWDFLLEAAADKVEREDQYYFMSYVLSANLVLALLGAAIVDLSFFRYHFPWWVWVVFVVMLLVFGQDAWRLRCNIAENSRKLLEEARRNKRGEASSAS
jgi:hypothetical protein